MRLKRVGFVEGIWLFILTLISLAFTIIGEFFSTLTMYSWGISNQIAAYVNRKIYDYGDEK